MKVLFTGKSGSGSWQCRAVQLGAAMGATVKPMATRQDFDACDVAVVVKRTPEPMMAALRASGKPWVYDVVDAYPQPQSSAWSRAEACDWLRAKVASLNPTAVIWPTGRMAADSKRQNDLVLAHHHRPNIARNPVRPEIRAVGYEGRPAYLAEWAGVFERECAKRGWAFVVNPPNLADLDIVIAARGREWSGYVTSAYKSNVKLANAHGSGTPFLGQPDEGYVEYASGAEYWFEDKRGISTAFDWLTSQTAREQVQDRFLAAAYSVDQAAFDLSEFLHRVV